MERPSTLIEIPQFNTDTMTATEAGNVYLMLNRIASAPETHASISCDRSIVESRASYSQGPYSDMKLTFAGFNEALADHFVTYYRRLNLLPLSKEQIMDAGGYFKLEATSRDDSVTHRSVHFTLSPQGILAVQRTPEGYVPTILTEQEINLLNIMSFLTLVGDRINRGVPENKFTHDREINFIGLVEECTVPEVQNIFKQFDMDGIRSTRIVNGEGVEGVFGGGMSRYLKTADTIGKNAIEAFRMSLIRSSPAAILPSAE